MTMLAIPVFDKGLVTNADPEDIAVGALVVSTNFENDVTGKFIKRKGRGNDITLTGDNVEQIIKWTTQDLANPVWIYYDSSAKKIRTCAADFTSAADIKALDSSTTDSQINNYGRILRFANGLLNKAGIYQTIDRQFFFGNKDLSDSSKISHYDDATPALPTIWESQSITDIGTGNRQSGHYYYKFVPIFDGIQEHPLPDSFSYAEITNSDKTLRVGLKMGMITGSPSFNPRITAVKVYRSFSSTDLGNIDPVYYHIRTISLNTKSTHEDNLGSESVTPLNDQFYFSNSFATEPTDFGYGNNGTVRLYLNTTTGSGTGYTVNSDGVTWPGTSTGGVLNLTGNFGTADLFNGKWSLAVDEQGEPTPTIYSRDDGGFAGKNVLYKSDWDWFSNEASGQIIYSSAESVEEMIINSMKKAVKVSSDLTQTSAFTVGLTDGYRYQVVGTNATLWFYDYDLNDKSLHPLGNKTKVTVNHKYSTFIGGRQFVGNVMLDPDGEEEEHEDWVIYSELLQPDVLPITNYIQVKDSQGGAITGLSDHLGSLVVFMERGVYRLDVPSTDPADYSLMEAEENFGCVAPNSIVTIGSQTFFAGIDNAYVIDPGFSISPITEAIKDIYQSTSNIEQSRFFYDPKKGRMLCRFGSEKQNIYSFDIRRGQAGQAVWHKLDLHSKAADMFALDSNLDVYSVTNGSNADIKLVDSSSTSEAVTASFKTGWFQVSELDDQSIIRRINARYSSGDDITANLYVNGDSSTVEQSITFRANSGETGITLTSSINSTTTVLPTTSTTKLKNGDWIKVGSEIMKVVTAGTTSHTVQRGMRGTTAASASGKVLYANYPNDSIRISTRAKLAQVELSAPSSTNSVEINKLEIEY